MSLEYLIKTFKANRTILFDLDNTIYPEIFFLEKVYKEISLEYNYETSKEVYDYLIKTFKNEGRRNIFNEMLSRFHNKDLDINKCLKIMRSYVCYDCISPFEWFLEFSRNVDKNFIFRILTNGNPDQQKNKILSINFPFNRNKLELVYANKIKQKPHTEAFYSFQDHELFHNPIYIGDSNIDKKFCENLSIEFFNIERILGT